MVCTLTPRLSWQQISYLLFCALGIHLLNVWLDVESIWQPLAVIEAFVAFGPAVMWATTADGFQSFLKCCFKTNYSERWADVLELGGITWFCYLLLIWVLDKF